MSVEIKIFSASNGSTASTLARLGDQLPQGPFVADLIFVFFASSRDPVLISRFLDERFPGVPRIGGSSGAGPMTEQGFGDDNSIGILVLSDPQGSYGSASISLGDDVVQSAEQALLAALEFADSPGELPELVWIYQSPGHEEQVVEGIKRVVGDRCPILGGSAADVDVSGQWSLIGPDTAMDEGLVVAVLFSSGGIGFSFEGGYEPIGASGVITAVSASDGWDDPPDSDGSLRAEGWGGRDGSHFSYGSPGSLSDGDDVGRHILEIDGEPAAEVYNRWFNGIVTDEISANGGNILTSAATTPLAIAAGTVDDVSSFRLIHPSAVTNEGGLMTFAQVRRGQRVYAMRGDRQRLIERVGRVAENALWSLDGESDSVAGGLVVYCAGCLLSLGEDATKVADVARASFGTTPFIGCFTFGEQGKHLGSNVHANLMISAVVFGR